MMVAGSWTTAHDSEITRDLPAVSEPSPRLTAEAKGGAAAEEPVDSPRAGIVRTEWIVVEFSIREVIEPDYAEPRKLEDLARKQREFLSTIKDPLEDVDLPPIG